MKLSVLPWEHGSDFHLTGFASDGNPELPPRAQLYGSGRDAIRSVIQHGVHGQGWKRLWVPSYFCQTVVKDIRIDGLEVRAYRDNLWHDQDEPDDIPDDKRGAVLYMNPFGLRSRNRPISFDRDRIALIEDHTHDPWSSLVHSSNADYCVVSLRKTIPIADGGAAWSPTGKEMPICPEPTVERTRASIQKHAGMVLKSLYLHGLEDDKPLFRRFLIQGEQGMAQGAISGMPWYSRALLDQFPAAKWRQRRRANFQRIASKIDPAVGVQVIEPSGPDAVPFCTILVASSQAIRDRLRTGLIEAGIYPAILWDLENPDVEGISVEDLALSRTMLCVHCDARYAEADMDRVAKRVNAEMGSQPVGSRNGVFVC